MGNRPASKHLTQQLLGFLADLVRPNLSIFMGEGHLRTWTVALVVGLLSACASVAFRLAINAFQLLWLGTMSERVVSAAQSVAWPSFSSRPPSAASLSDCSSSWCRAGGQGDRPM